MTARQLLELLGSPDAPFVLDVRSRAEFEAGHVPGARHLPFEQTIAGLPDAERDLPIVIYCGHGPRAWFAAAMLRLHGYSKVDLLEGHLSRWREENLPLERS
jgi:rhodanese-related sulfurtransferase